MTSPSQTPENVWARKIKFKYGISVEEYNELYIKQSGCCAICKKHQSELDRRLAVDHDHENGWVRGLLCRKCNQALGLFEDNKENVRNALKYIEENEL